MVYFSAILIAFLSSLLNVSFFPHFLYLSLGFNIFLPFLAMYSIKDKTLFPVLLAFFAGIMYDAFILYNFPIFTILFLFVTITAKLLFNNDSSYNVDRTALIVVGLGLFLQTILNYQVLQNSFTELNLYLSVAGGIIFTLLWAIIMYKLFPRYFDWVEKTTSERFR